MSEPGAAPPPPPPPVPALPPPIGAKRVIGIIIMLLGIALTVGSGLCTTVFMVNDMTSSGGGEINLSGVEFIVGGPFILIGALMWWGGARLKRRPPP
ncbi:MAG TPA: hypothetical protein VFA91_15675 [Candidatus Polarisedimenticolia bacterium]|nr:hypothetical protein [Candidatus Polarisedimenticolia bacterium]